MLKFLMLIVSSYLFPSIHPLFFPCTVELENGDLIGERVRFSS